MGSNWDQNWVKMGSKMGDIISYSYIFPIFLYLLSACKLGAPVLRGQTLLELGAGTGEGPNDPIGSQVGDPMGMGRCVPTCILKPIFNRILSDYNRI